MRDEHLALGAVYPRLEVLKRMLTQSGGYLSRQVCYARLSLFASRHPLHPGSPLSLYIN